MAVREFELFHGIVLTKLVRSERTVNLRLIETRPAEAWSAYRINEELDLFIKHSTAARPLTRCKGGRSWSFVFGQGQLGQMAESVRHARACVALVGGGPDVKARDAMQVCLLEPKQVADLIDLPCPTQQAITVRYIPGSELRVFKGKKEKFKVPQGRLDKWPVPGS